LIGESTLRGDLVVTIKKIPKRLERLKIPDTVVSAAGPVKKADIPPQSERAKIRFHSRIWVETSVNPRGTQPWGEENTVPDRLGRENALRMTSLSSWAENICSESSGTVMCCIWRNQKVGADQERSGVKMEVLRLSKSTSALAPRSLPMEAQKGPRLAVQLALQAWLGHGCGA
jgi:hypothetical protein